MASERWFVVNARDARWYVAPGRSTWCDFEGERDFPQIGINIQILDPGVPMGMYHWEAHQEDFLVLAGEAVLLVEGQERPLKTWDFVHCPPHADHIIVGAGDAPCVVLCVGARGLVNDADWGGYVVDETALRHGASVAEATTDAEQAYAHVPKRAQTRYRDGWLPG